MSAKAVFYKNGCIPGFFSRFLGMNLLSNDVFGTGLITNLGVA